MTLDDLRPALFFQNLTVRQLAMLLVISQSPKKMMCRELAQRLHVSRPVVSRGWDALSSVGLITRYRDEDDKRNVYAVLTDKGKKFAESMG